MDPEWRESGPINRALKMIGVSRGPLGDRFSALGLGAYRSNDDLIDAAIGDETSAARADSGGPV